MPEIIIRPKVTIETEEKFCGPGCEYVIVKDDNNVFCALFRNPLGSALNGCCSRPLKLQIGKTTPPRRCRQCIEAERVST